LREFGAPESLIDPAFMASHEPITQIGMPPLRIDFIAALSGVSFDEVAAGAVDTVIDGGENTEWTVAASCLIPAATSPAP
jgi:hypothetical protein